MSRWGPLRVDMCAKAIRRKVDEESKTDSTYIPGPSRDLLLAEQWLFEMWLLLEIENEVYLAKVGCVIGATAHTRETQSNVTDNKEVKPRTTRGDRQGGKHWERKGGRGEWEQLPAWDHLYLVEKERKHLNGVFPDIAWGPKHFWSRFSTHRLATKLWCYNLRRSQQVQL